MEKISDYGKNVLRETLFLLDDVCKKLNIKFYLSHGTLLGAVKYKGFIPWEDDLDVMMSRKDYSRLKDYILSHPNEEYGIGFAECGYFSPDFFGKFFNKKYLCLEEGCLLTHPWADIYILSPVREKELKNYCGKLKWGISITGLANRKVRYTDWYDSDLKIWFYNNFHRKSVLPKKYAEKYFYRILTEYENKNADSYLLMSPGVFYMIDEKLYKKEWFLGEDKTVEFEGREFLAPCMYDTILKTGYGDYMNTLPPENEQKPKHGTLFLNDGEHFVCSYAYPEEIGFCKNKKVQIKKYLL